MDFDWMNCGDNELEGAKGDELEGAKGDELEGATMLCFV